MQQIFGDVKAALNIWMSFSISDCCEKGGGSALSENIIILLYNIIDLIQLKVCLSSLRTFVSAYDWWWLCFNFYGISLGFHGTSKWGIPAGDQSLQNEKCLDRDMVAITVGM